jgi:uncharacterized protein RhaS with RHS repeats
MNFPREGCRSEYRARYYDPQIGRFLSEDRLRWYGSATNFYAYVGNDPADLVDPTGNFPPGSHSKISERAALAAGYSPAEAKQLAKDVVDVDSLPGTQSTDFEMANLHAMSGKKPNNMYQSCLNAYGEALGQLAHYIEVGNPAAIAAAVHMIEDSYAPAHGPYAEWHDDLSGWAGHIANETWGWIFSTGEDDAQVAVQVFLRDLKDNSSSLKYPSNYLNKCGCK